MAREFGLGITPWSPLKSGALSGKYTRTTQASPRPIAARSSTRFLTEQTYALIDELEVIAADHETTVARRGAGVGSARSRRELDHHRGTQALAARRQRPRRRCAPHCR